MITVLYSLLSPSDLAVLVFCLENDMLEVMCDLHAIFDILEDLPLPIPLCHILVDYFLLSIKKYTDEHLAYVRIPCQCLMIKTMSLKKNIYGLNELSML